VIVYGDTNSTLAGGLAAVQAGIPLAHVEAGLRSYNRSMPEETNRIVADAISSYLFCPTPAAVENLEREGLRTGVHVVGDVMKDALDHNLPIARKRSKIMATLGLARGAYALATVHRAANTDDPGRVRMWLEGLGSLSAKVVLPLHPRTSKMIEQHGLTLAPNLQRIEPLGYLDMLVLHENAECVLTDSGGLQKEAYLLGVRCLTLRDETEWVETVEAGWNRLVGVEPRAIKEAFETWKPAAPRPDLYGDGHASERICNILSKSLG
jgi:UDP-N-acetylglucosamine 2-epimerase